MHVYYECMTFLYLPCSNLAPISLCMNMWMNGMTFNKEKKTNHNLNMWKANLKCAFGVSSGKFLGFLVHSRGIDVDPAKATAIETMRPPVTVKELKSFIGKVSYIRRFIPGLASITSAFTKLLKKGQIFEWGEAQQTAFKRLQQIIMNLPTV